MLAERPAPDADSQVWDRWAGRVLAAFDQFQLLCAVRKGAWGVEALNERIAEALVKRGLLEQSHGWYEGRPVLVTRNDYSLGLMNGDIGIALRLPEPPEFQVRLYARCCALCSRATTAAAPCDISCPAV